MGPSSPCYISGAFRDGRRDFSLESFLLGISGFQMVAMLQVVSFSREVVLLGR